MCHFFLWKWHKPQRTCKSSRYFVWVSLIEKRNIRDQYAFNSAQGYGHEPSIVSKEEAVTFRFAQQEIKEKKKK